MSRLDLVYFQNSKALVYGMIFGLTEKLLLDPDLVDLESDKVNYNIFKFADQ